MAPPHGLLSTQVAVKGTFGPYISGILRPRMTEPGPLSEESAVDDLQTTVYAAELGWLSPVHRTWLDEVEQGRLAGLRRASDRDRFVLGTALLRCVIGDLMGGGPKLIKLDRRCLRCGAPHGAPKVIGLPGTVSVTHSGNRVLVAISENSRVGVDVEKMITRDIGEFADLVFSAEENSDVSAPEFYVAWTRKEAVLKATGDGLTRSMAEVVLGPVTERPRLRRLAGRPGWSGAIADLEVGAGYAAAVACLRPVSFGSGTEPRLRVDLAGPDRVRSLLGGRS
ncbi:4'-phosphopantetheinyl transferase family protein [Microlunatus sp. GCM10028923]|uniref:4'-phosphopantetheinyl transferase family protein n=1 Tax=Microlunatus sp. GCM10028923 TaxID=3273400 RepID=UPI00360BFB9F